MTKKNELTEIIDKSIKTKTSNSDNDFSNFDMSSETKIAGSKQIFSSDDNDCKKTKIVKSKRGVSKNNSEPNDTVNTQNNTQNPENITPLTEAERDRLVEDALFECAVKGKNVTALIFWLKNRRPDLWRDKPEAEHCGIGALQRLLDYWEKGRKD